MLMYADVGIYCSCMHLDSFLASCFSYLYQKDEQQIKKEIQAAIDPAELNSSPLKLDDILVDVSYANYSYDLLCLEKLCT